ncbi:MAG: hypothetical protein ACOYUZ_02350 [Patescibacteria group bacterium]
MSKTKTNVLVVLLSAVGFAAAFGIGIWAVQKRAIKNPLPKPHTDLMPAKPGYNPPGYNPPGYTPPGYTPPGYNPPGYTPPGYYPVTPTLSDMKSYPVITAHNPSDSILSNGQKELYRWQIGANNLGSIYFKQIAFYIKQSQGVTLSNFRLYRGAVQMAAGEYNVTEAFSGQDIKNGTMSSGELPIVVSLTNEDSIGGSGYVYRLYADVQTTQAGDYVMTKPLRSNDAYFGKGSLINKGLYPLTAQSAGIYNIDASDPVDGVADYPGFLIWSDNSALPHWVNSNDWFSDFNTGGLDKVVTLSK